jgi:hypothetical protein
MRRLLALVLLAGCSASAPEDDPGSGTEGPDAGDLVEPPPGPAMTLRQTSSSTITDTNGFSCSISVVDGPLYEHKDDAFYRVFDLAALELDRGFAVTSVAVGIESARTLEGDGRQPGAVRLHALTGELTLANLAPLATVEVEIEDQEMALLEVPIQADVAPGTKLVVEFAVPDSAGDGELLFIGSNVEPQTAPTYWRSTACGVPEPTDVAVAPIDHPEVHAVLEVRGHAR